MCTRKTSTPLSVSRSENVNFLNVHKKLKECKNKFDIQTGLRGIGYFLKE